MTALTNDLKSMIKMDTTEKYRQHHQTSLSLNALNYLQPYLATQLHQQSYLHENLLKMNHHLLPSLSTSLIRSASPIMEKHDTFELAKSKINKNDTHHSPYSMDPKMTIDGNMNTSNATNSLHGSSMISITNDNKICRQNILVEDDEMEDEDMDEDDNEILDD